MARRPLTASDRAAAVAKLARTMSPCAVSRVRTLQGSRCGPRWLLVQFLGDNGSESRGVVDVLAIRKDHRPPRKGLLRGDDFEVVVIQVKGGSALFSSVEDIERLCLVARRLRANDVVLAQHADHRTTLYVLRDNWRVCINGKTRPRAVWSQRTGSEIFGRSA